MSITGLNTAASTTSSGASYTISAGSNRALIVGVQQEGSITADAVGVTWGGKTLTRVVSQFISDGATSIEVALFLLLEADIATASGSTLVITGAVTNFTVHARSAAGVNQGGGASTVAATTAASANASTPNPIVTADISAVPGSAVLALAGCGQAATATWGGTNPLTKETDQAVASTAQGSLATRLASSVQTAAVRCTWSGQNRAAVVAMTLLPSIAIATSRTDDGDTIAAVLGVPTGGFKSLTIVDSTPIDPISTIGIDGSAWVASVVLKGTTSTVGTLDASKLTIQVSDPGYTAAGGTTTVTRTITGVAHLKRQNPNGNSRMISTDGTDLTLLITLDDWIYAGTTIVSAAIASGFYTGSAATTSASNTNNSEEDYPKPTFAWINLQNERSTGSTHYVEGCFAHRHGRAGQMIAFAEYYATDGTHTDSAETVGSTILSTLQTRGNIAEAWAATVSMSTQTQGGTSKIIARGYPWIGDSSAVLDLSADGYTWPTPKPLTPLRVLCDRTGGYGGAFAYVDGVGAGTPAVSSSATTARANPYATIQAALAAVVSWNNSNKSHNDSGGASIRLIDAAGSNKLYTINANVLGTPGATWCVVEPDPTNTGAVSVTIDGFHIFSEMIKWKVNCVSSAGTSYMFVESSFGGSTGTQVAFDGITIDNTINRDFCSGYSFVSIRNVHMLGGNAVSFSGFAPSDQSIVCAIGVTQDVTDSNLRYSDYAQVWIGCDLRGQTINRVPPGKGGDGMFIYNNRVSIIDVSETSATTIATGMAVVQNLAEKRPSDGQAAAIKSFADGDLTTIKNYIQTQNTGVGERSSQLYNDTGTTAVKKGASRYNIWENYNSKHDEFQSGVGSLGAYSYAYSVGNVGNVSLFGAVQEDVNNAPSNSGTDQYMGFAWLPSSEYNLGRTALGFSQTQIMDMFENYTCAPRASPANGGNYRPKGTSTQLLNRVPANMAMFKYDISGVPRRNDGTGAAGAYEALVAHLTATRTDAGDTIVADFSAASTSANVTATRTDTGDTLAAAVSNVIALTGTRTDAGDTLAAAVSNVVKLTATRTDTGDTLAAGLGVPSATVTATRTDAGDTTSAAFANVIRVVFARTDTGDAILAAFADDIASPEARITATRTDAGDAPRAWLGLPPVGKTFRVTVGRRLFGVRA